ncbi:MAG TPA: hydrogen peroxide-inducible genes activator [Hyphomicrobiales bacterium]|nr:hydrogen peroxide-inducible genes activator [Hyphomicrobiales bacterium]
MKELNFSLKQLRYFLVASRHRSLRQAALELGITQPSLSAQLKLLEETLGVKLFERTRGGVSLTPMGRDMLIEASQAVSAAEAILDTATFATKGPTGTFRLGTTPSLGPYSLPWILPSVRQSYRGVKFFVQEAPSTLLVSRLKSGQYDFIFTTLPIDDPSLTVVPLFREPIYLIVHAEHPLASLGEIAAEQLAGLEILAIEEHHLFFRQVDDLCRRFHAQLLRDFEGSSLDAIRQMVQMDMGSAFLPALYIRAEIRDRSDLQVLEVAGEPIFRVHALAWRSTSPLRSFYRGLSEFFQDRAREQFGDDIVLQ